MAQTHTCLCCPQAQAWLNKGYYSEGKNNIITHYIVEADNNDAEGAPSMSKLRKTVQLK